MTAIKKIFTFLSLSLILTAAINSADAKTTDSSKDSIRKQIVGTWQLKQFKSNVESKKNQSLANETESAIPESLVLAADEEFGEITINEGFEKVIHTQTLPLNDAGEKRNNGTTTKAFWNGKKLIVEAVAANGSKLTETFELGANKNQLKVMLRLDGAKKSKAIVTRRVYDRTNEQSGGDDTTAEIPVSQFLL